MIKTHNDILAEVEPYVFQFFQEHISPKYVYHDFPHTKEVMETARQIAEEHDLGRREITIIQFAAWFHDLGYDQGGEGHEERSCQYAEEFLLPRDYPQEELELVLGCIRATKIGEEPQNLLEQILCDADLSHIGSKFYWDRCSRVRQELLLTQNRIMSEKEWVNFELDFMTHHSFYTDVARNMFEKRKLKNIRLLKKYRLRLNPDTVDMEEELELEEKKKKKKKKKGEFQGDEAVLKQGNIGRGVETMFRTTYRTHISLSSIADNKANIMLSINAIIVSIVVSNLVPKFGDNPHLILPTFVLLAVCLTALVFAILSTRPKVTKGEFSREDIENKQSNLLFFGNFYKMDIDDFHWGMMEMINDNDFLYSSMTRDLYYLGVVLAKKYHYLRICYNVFMFGLILSVIAFGIAFLL